MAYQAELIAISPELKKKLDELKHKLNFSPAADWRAKRVLAYGDLIQKMYDFYITSGMDKKDLEVPQNEASKGTDTVSSTQA